MAGLFVTFEGPEGAGKSTQMRLLTDRLTSAGLDLVATREPGGTAIGERIREVLLSASSGEMCAETEALLMSAARAQHVAKVIRPALARDQLVLCDRYVDSTLAYQGGGRGIPLDELRHIQRFATGGLDPDLRILLDLPVEIGLQRRFGDLAPINRMDTEDLAFHERVRQAYIMLSTSCTWVVVDAEQAPDIVSNRIFEVVSELLARRRQEMSIVMESAT